MSFKIGHGFDAHQLALNESFILGGISIDFEKGIKGHSDGDVLVHSIIDSLLGAINEGDIGSLFPPSKTNQNISSLKLLEQVGELLSQKYFDIINIDTTIILQEPKIVNYRNQIKKNICSILNINQSQLSIKATTTDGLGFIGLGEGIASHAISLIKYHGS